MAAAHSHAPAGKFDQFDRNGGLRGYRQKEAYRLLRARRYSSPEDGWMTVNELAEELYGEVTTSTRVGVHILILRMRQHSVPIETKPVPRGTPSAYRLRRPTT